MEGDDNATATHVVDIMVVVITNLVGVLSHPRGKEVVDSKGRARWRRW